MTYFEYVRKLRSVSGLTALPLSRVRELMEYTPSQQQEWIEQIGLRNFEAARDLILLYLNSTSS